MRGEVWLGASLKLRCLARLAVAGDSLHSMSGVRGCEIERGMEDANDMR